MDRVEGLRRIVRGTWYEAMWVTAMGRGMGSNGQQLTLPPHVLSVVTQVVQWVSLPGMGPMPSSP